MTLNIAVYYGMVSLDKYIGLIVDKLDTLPVPKSRFSTRRIHICPGVFPTRT